MPATTVIPGILYGPVDSRRFGRSLGINLSGPGKYCSFACPYCFRGYNAGRPDNPAFAAELPAATAVLAALEQAAVDPQYADVVDWTFAGNAEPTDHPEFCAIVEGALAIRDRCAPRVKLSLLSNGMALLPRLRADHARVAAAIRRVDRPCLKLDAGTPAMFQRLSVPAFDVTYEEWLAALAALPGMILQTMLVHGRIDNTTDEEIAGIAAAAIRLRPRELHLVTLNKPPADAGLLPVPRQRVDDIQRRLHAALRDITCPVRAWV